MLIVIALFEFTTFAASKITKKFPSTNTSTVTVTDGVGPMNCKQYWGNDKGPMRLKSPTRECTADEKSWSWTWWGGGNDKGPIVHMGAGNDSHSPSCYGIVYCNDNQGCERCWEQTTTSTIGTFSLLKAGCASDIKGGRNSNGLYGNTKRSCSVCKTETCNSANAASVSAAVVTLAVIVVAKLTTSGN